MAYYNSVYPPHFRSEDVPNHSNSHTFLPTCTATNTWCASGVWREPELSGPPIKQEFHDLPGRPSLFESAGYGESRTSNDWPRQIGIIPLQGSPGPVIKRDLHDQERQLMIGNDRQPPSAYNGLADQRTPNQNIVHCNTTYPPPFRNEDPVHHLEYPPVENQSPSVTYESFGIPQGKNHSKKASRTSQACKQCREAKAKCQDEKPCQTCNDKNIICDYKADERYLSTITYRFDKQEKILRQILTRLSKPKVVLNKIHTATDFNVLVEEPLKKDLGALSYQGSPSPSRSNRFQSSKNEEEAEPLPDFGPAVPLYHTTATSGILSWRSIQALVGETIPDTAMRDATLYSARHGQTQREAVQAYNSKPDLRSDTVSRLISLYMNHVNVIHPILSPSRLKTLFMRFINSSNSAKSTSKEVIEEARRLKRKRPVGDAEALNDAFIGSKMPEPSIELALLLLVLTLGKIYDYKEKLAHAFHEGGEKLGGLALPLNSYPSPEEVDQSWVDRYPSVNGSFSQTLGNMDITPGLDYFAAAIDIVGNIDDRDSQCYVQVQILTSLYQRQLGQLSKSHAAISEAARALQVILRSKYIQSRTTGWDNALLITFWTCLIIESEIIAELPVPQSNLDSWERFMPWPIAQTKDFMNTVHRDGYRIQLLLRKHLNTILPKLYAHGHPNKDDKVPVEEQAISYFGQSTIDYLEAYVSKMAGPPTSESSDSNSITILSAQLKAKILGVKAITLRPYLMMVLNREHTESEISEKIQDYARLCIETLHRGAEALNYLKGDQLIAYAQFANVMILLAAFCDDSLKYLIRSALLGDLVNQALDSLMAWPSSELAQKYVKVLKAMAMKADLYEQPKHS